MRITVEAELRGLRYVTESFSVALLTVLESEGINIKEGSTITATGRLPAGLLIPGQRYIVSGVFESSKWGMRLKVESITPLRHGTEEGMKRFLSSGIIKGIGDVIAERLVASFGKDALDVMERRPDELLNVRGIGERTALRIASSLREKGEFMRSTTEGGSPASTKKTSSS